MNKENDRIPNWRQHIMRGLFLLNFIALAFDNWTEVIAGTLPVDIYPSVAVSFWAAFSLLNLIGVMNPLRFIPILMLQLLYKAAWLLGNNRPAYFSGELTASQEEFFWICVAGVVLNLLIIPWKYTWHHFIKYQRISTSKT